MTYKVIVSNTARLQLRSHIAFLASVSPSGARSTKQRLMDAFRSLEHMPQRYPFLDEEFLPRSKYRKLYVPSCYLILYQIRDATVYIDYVLDCRQDYSWLLPT